MKVWGVPLASVAAVVEAVGLVPDNVHQVGRAVSVKVSPISSRALYARTNENGRHLRAACYHGFRDTVLAWFAAGATRVDSAVGILQGKNATWRSPAEFVADLRRLYNLPVGSPYYGTVPMGDLCACESSGGFLYGQVEGADFDPHDQIVAAQQN